MIMSHLRSRKDVTKATDDNNHDDDGDERGGSKVHRRGFSNVGPLSCAVHPAVIGVITFVLFVIGLKVSAPPPQKRYSGMAMVRTGDQHKSMFSDGHGKQVQKVSRKGIVEHHAITAVKKEDLKGLVADLPEEMQSITYEEAIQGREPLVDILNDAGVEDLDVPTILSLPKWSQVSKLYGEGPVVIGLETCQQFRDTIPVDDASIGTAGADLENYSQFICGLALTLVFFSPSTRHVQHWNESVWNVY
jgi:hypothetical protein